jgi:hypothetical protein
MRKQSAELPTTSLARRTAQLLQLQAVATAWSKSLETIALMPFFGTQLRTQHRDGKAVFDGR